MAEPLSEGSGGATSGDDCIQPGNWPMLGGNEGNINAACREGPADGTVRYSVGFQGAGGAVLSIGHLLILTTSSVWGGTNAVHALDSSDGTVMWTRSFESHPFPTASGRGLLFVGTFEGTLFALQPSTGNIVWTFSTDAPGDDWIVPIYADGIVLGASFDGYLHAIDANNGQELWRFRPGTAHYPSVGLGMVFLAVNNELYALDQSTGTAIWSASLDSFIGGVPVVSGDTIIVATGGFGASGSAYAFDARTGASLWTHQIGFDAYVESVAHGIVLITGPWPQTTSLIALDAATGSSLWNYGPAVFPQYGVTVAGSEVLAVTFDGSLHALDLTTGAERWTASLAGSMHNQVRPIPFRGNIAVATGDGLHVFGALGDSPP